MIVLELDIDHCCHWEKPCVAAPPSLGPRVEPPCRVQSGWNALGCGAAPTVGNRRNNSHSMDSNDPYLHLSKYASTIYLQRRSSVVLLLTLMRVRLFHGVFSPVCELCAKATADFNHRLPSSNGVVKTTLFVSNYYATMPIVTKAATNAKVR